MDLGQESGRERKAAIWGEGEWSTPYLYLFILWNGLTLIIPGVKKSISTLLWERRDCTKGSDNGNLIFGIWEAKMKQGWYFF